MKVELETPPTPEEEVPNEAAFSGFAKYWFDTHSVNLKPNTIDAYEVILRNHLVPFFGDQDLRSISVEQVEAFKSKMVKAGRSPKSVNNYLGVGGRMFHSAIDWEYADNNPFHRTERLKEPQFDYLIWEREQSDAFLATVMTTEPKWHSFFLTALRTGMRQGELFGLQWSDLDFVKKKLHIKRSIRKRRVSTPKNNRFRTVPMSNQVAEALRSHRHLRSDWMFTRDDGRPLTRNAIKWPFWRLTAAAGLPRIRFHDLRHSFASQLVMAGIPLAGVMELLGHADIKMTMRNAHLAPSETAKYIQVLEGAENIWARFGHTQGSAPPLVAHKGGLT